MSVEAPENLDRPALGASRLAGVTDEQLAVAALARFTAEELLALYARRSDAEQRYADELAALVSERFWCEVESDPDTDAAFDRLAAEWSAPPRSGLSQRPEGVRDSSKYGQAALESELARLAGVEVGERNQKLNLSAYALGRLVGAGYLDAGRVAGALLEAGRALGLADHEITSTVKSGLAAGVRRPRR